jgi:hypothetical protein
MVVVKAASYNTSVFGAKKFLGETVPVFASEARFLADRPGVTYDGVDLVGYNDFFKNALDHLIKHVMSEKVKVIGIQEYEPGTLDTISTKINDGELKDPKSARNYFDKWNLQEFIKSVAPNHAKILTLWSPELGAHAGETYVYENDLPNIPELAAEIAVPGINDTGRPITIIKTTENFYLMNFHGINRPKYVTKGMIDALKKLGVPEAELPNLNALTGFDVSTILKKLLIAHVKLAEKQFGMAEGTLPADRLIIMCDSNDREHGINKNSPLEINGGKFHDGYANTGGVRSCCYNYDSCGRSPADAPTGAPSTMGASGAETAYAYTGDYVLGANVRSQVKLIPSPQDSQGASVASDHTLVIGELNIGDGLAGGRRKRRHTKRRVLRKQRKTRSGRRKSKSVRTSKYQS